MRKGELQQVASPQQLYDHPVNLFVGGFIGSPAMNMVEATLERRDGSIAAVIGDQSLTLAEETVATRPALKSYEARTIILGIRPEYLEDASLARDIPEDRRLKGRVDLREALGSELMVHFTIKGTPAVTEDVRELAADVGGDTASKELDREQQQATLVGRFGARAQVQEGEEAEIAVDTSSLHFFDPESGLGIYDGEITKGGGS
jgi:multiple sugar transport system ATP-binding protein